MSMITPIINRMSSCALSARQCIVKHVPAFSPTNKKLINGIKWMGEHMSSPHQRLILGASALMSQPFIDLYNKGVDEDTRKISAARTVAKIIAGTTTGVAVRYGCIKAIDAFTKNPATATKGWQSLLYPKGILNVTKEGLQHHKFALGTFISLGVMLFTNILIDAPLTKFLTNKFVDKIKSNNLKEAQHG